MTDIVALGEVLIDFTPNGYNDQGNVLYAQNPGGAPANVLAMSAKLGDSVAFIGKVGADSFGDFLSKSLQSAGINVKSLIRTEETYTTLAFVHLGKGGERSFSFYRNPGADTCLTIEEIPNALIDECKIFHFGSISLTNEPSRSATFYAVQRARQNGVVVSFDPNYRPALWEKKNDAISMMRKGVELTNILKVSREEMTLLTEEKDIMVGAKRLLEMGPQLVLITDGENGACFATPNLFGSVHAYPFQAVDTTGAGDAFLGAVLHCLKNYTLNQILELKQEQLITILRYANAAGGYTTTKIGAIPAMPTQEEIDNIVKTMPMRAHGIADS